MTRHQAIAKASKLGFQRGFRVRFGFDGAVYALDFRGRSEARVMACWTRQADGNYTEAQVGQTVKLADLRSVPTPEPENQEGLE